METDQIAPLFILTDTLKFLTFGTPEIFDVIYLKIQTKRTNLKGLFQNGENGIAQSEDSDQTAPLKFTEP